MFKKKVFLLLYLFLLCMDDTLIHVDEWLMLFIAFSRIHAFAIMLCFWWESFTFWPISAYLKIASKFSHTTHLIWSTTACKFFKFLNFFCRLCLFYCSNKKFSTITALNFCTFPATTSEHIKFKIFKTLSFTISVKNIFSHLNNLFSSKFPLLPQLSKNKKKLNCLIFFPAMFFALL